MNFDLNNLPERTKKPRQYGFTMAMDKGLSIREAEDFASTSADHVDIVKLGWATSFVTPNLKDKLKVYKEAGIPVYFGGPCLKRLSFEINLKIIENFSTSMICRLLKYLMGRWTLITRKSVTTSRNFVSK
jgi:phosphosulfolactate synthase (CoM biosynthesis protein A)